MLAAGGELTSAVITQIATSISGHRPVPETLDGCSGNIRLVGEAINAPQEAADLTADVRGRIDAVSKPWPARRRRAFYEVGGFQGTIYTAGEDSFRSG